MTASVESSDKPDSFLFGPPTFVRVTSFGLVLTLVGLCVQGLTTGQLVLLNLLLNGPMVGLILLASIGLGRAACMGMRFEPDGMAWRPVFFGILGLGLMGVLVLLFGVLGALQAWIWWAIVLASGAIGAIECLRAARFLQDASSRRERWIWLGIVPFVVLILLVSSTPPGVLWNEEGFGYDALEYHLQLPKEYLQNGVITYLPHNVYANLPSHVEMLYLLCMRLRGDVDQGAMGAKLLNAAMALGGIAVAWQIGRRQSIRAGYVAALLYAGTGWVTYLSGVAFVENGMLLFGITALLLIEQGVFVASVEGKQMPSGGTHESAAPRGRRLFMAGVMTGFAGGCKLTALPLIVLPLGFYAAWLYAGTVRRALGAGLIFLLGSLVALAPWLIKNQMMTGNPVFPLMNSVFHAYPAGWGPEESEHFDESHRPVGDEATLSARLRAWWEHVPGEFRYGSESSAARQPTQRFGAVLFLLAMWASIARRHARRTRGLLLVFVLQSILWAATTHLYARFAVPLLIPLIALAAESTPASNGRHKSARFHGLVVIAGLLVNFVNIVILYRQHLHPAGTKLLVEGAIELFTEGNWPGYEHFQTINGELPPTSHILVVGDARAFYFDRPIDYNVVFNRNPFMEAVRASADVGAIMGWLKEKGYTHVFVNWAEITRLRSSQYGFPSEIEPSLFERLKAEGLRLIETYEIPLGDRRIQYGQLFEVPGV